MHVKERCIEDKSNRSSINTLKKKIPKKESSYRNGNNRHKRKRILNLKKHWSLQTEGSY